MKAIDANIAWPFDDENEWIQAARGNNNALLYARNTPAPIVTELEQRVATMESAECGLAFSSGMAAIYATLFSVLKPGATIVALDALYGGSFSLLKHVFPKWGVNCRLVSTEAELIQKIQQGCDAVYIESPSNPLLIETDIVRITSQAKQQNALVICDNTVATPFAQNPIQHGADIVIHSATKFLGGHMDALAGIVCCNTLLRDEIHAHRELIGSVLAPQAAQLISRGLDTFELRMKRATQNARNLAEWLNAHPAVVSVNYPRLESTRPCSNLSNDIALLSFELASRNDVSTFLTRATQLTMASTLGATSTLIGLPETTSHVECTPEERIALGVPVGLIRISVGIEPWPKIEAAFDAALSP